MGCCVETICWTPVSVFVRLPHQMVAAAVEGKERGKASSRVVVFVFVFPCLTVCLWLSYFLCC